MGAGKFRPEPSPRAVPRAWRSPGLLSLVALLALVVAVVAGASVESATELSADELAMGEGNAGHDHRADDHDHAAGDHGEGDHADGDHAGGAHPDGDHADGDHGPHPAGSGHDDHGDGTPHADHGDGHPDGAPHDDHPDGVPHDDHPSDVPHDDHPPDDPHAHPPPAAPTCDFGYSYPQPAAFTATDCVVAQQIVADTSAAISRYSSYDAAIADGFRSIEDHKLGARYEHLVHWGRLDDGHVMDPSYVESLVYYVRTDGSKQLQSGMYILPLGSNFGSIPAQYSSELTPWHAHTNLCWAYGPTGSLVVKALSRDGVACPSGTFYFATPPMLHVWIVPTPCGPFAEVEGAAGDCGHHSH